MRFKNFQIGKGKEKSYDDTDDIMATQIADLEEQVNDKTRRLAEAEQQLKALSSNVQLSAEDTDASPHPHGPLSELTIDPEDTSDEEIMGAANLFEETDDEIPVVEVIKAESMAKPEAKPEAEPAPATAAEPEAEAPAITEDDNSLASLFGNEEEEEKPLASLIESLPDVTPRELLDDLQELKDLIRERHRKGV